MILLITSSARAQECAAAIESATGEHTRLAAGLARATAELRSREYSALVLDQCLMEPDPEGADLLLDQAGTAIPVFLNFAISGRERVARDVRAALRRRDKERAAARKEAESILRSQLTEALTGILLSSQLALALPALPPAAQAKLRSVYQLAMLMRSRLEPVN